MKIMFAWGNDVLLEDKASGTICPIFNVSIEQSLKAEFPMEVTELGMVTLDSVEQPRKAEFSMEVTELGIVTLVRDEQS